MERLRWWAGILVRDATIGLQAIQSRLTSEQFKGRGYWRPATSSLVAHHFQNDSFAAYLLPGFDEFVLGYANRNDFLNDEHKQTILGINAVFAYTIVLDGQIVGTWKRTFRKSAVEITFSPFVPLSTAAHQAFATASRRYGEFFGLVVVNS